jgi:WD40 repeat protein
LRFHWFAVGQDGHTLIVAVRDDNYLHYIDLATFSVKKVNVNAIGDDYVSFNILDLSLSPGDGKYLLAVTDKCRLIMFKTGTPYQARNFYGTENDELSQIRCVWDPTSRFVYCSSTDRKVYVFDSMTARVVHTLAGHTNLIVCCH